MLALPKNSTLFGLHRLLDHATRWLDHCESQGDFNTIEDFITELEIKISEVTSTIDFLERCYGQTIDR